MRRLILLGMACLLLVFSGCSKTTESVSETASSVGNESSATTEKPDVVDGYLLVIDHLAHYSSSGIHSRDKYLAIDTSKMVNLTPEDKTRLLKELEKYNLLVLNKTWDQLEKEGYIDGSEFEYGMLIKIEDKKMESNSIMMDASRNRGALNAYGLLDFRIRFICGHWEMADINITWVS